MKADKGHKETDKLLEELEKRIADEYRQAVQETREKLKDYLRRYEIKDEKWRLMVERGEKTPEEYAAWRKSQIMVGKRWEAMKDQLATDYHNANVIARQIINDAMPTAYAMNHNFATYQIEHDAQVSTSYTLYSRETVERLLRDEPELLKPPGVQMKQTFKEWDAYKAGEDVDLDPKKKKAFDKLLAEGKDVRWQKGQIQSVTLQSILQGESIPNMTKRIASTMGETNHKATIRYARTAVTGAQNGGRQDAYRRAEALGIEMEREWVATLDNRTRHEHRILDGQKRAIDAPFEVDGYEIMYPGDPAAEGFLIWNCRCTTVAAVKGWEDVSGKLRSNEAIGGMSYEEWLEATPKYERITKQEETAEAMRRKTINELYRGRKKPKK